MNELFKKLDQCEDSNDTQISHTIECDVDYDQNEEVKVDEKSFSTMYTDASGDNSMKDNHDSNDSFMTKTIEHNNNSNHENDELSSDLICKGKNEDCKEEATTLMNSTEDESCSYDYYNQSSLNKDIRETNNMVEEYDASTITTEPTNEIFDMEECREDTNNINDCLQSSKLNYESLEDTDVSKLVISSDNIDSFHIDESQ